eukprot:87783-Prorocentrum_lima.AAC.1
MAYSGRIPDDPQRPHEIIFDRSEILEKPAALAAWSGALVQNVYVVSSSYSYGSIISEWSNSL